MDDQLGNDEERGISEKLAGAEAAERAGVSLSTLRRWVALGLFPTHDVSQGWGPSAIAQARSLVKLRERGYSIEQLQEAIDQGRIVGYADELVGERWLANVSRSSRPRSRAA